jgi:hypothetical protein
MARLTTSDRKALPTGAFAGPERSYPIEDRSHAVNALSRVSQYGTADLKQQVRDKVYRKYPDLRQGD